MNTIATPTAPISNVIPARFRGNTPQHQSFREVWDHIQGDSKEDFVAPRNRIKFHVEQDGLRVDIGGHADVAVNRHFVEQTASTLAPGLLPLARHLDAQGHHDILERTFNDILSKSEKPQIVRTVKNGDHFARAFLSDAFSPIDDDLVFATMGNALKAHRDRFRSLGGQRTDTRTHIKIITKAPIFKMDMGGRERSFFAGFHVSNSEVGSGSVMFRAFLFDHFCENGLTFGEAAIADCKFMHRGSRLSTSFGRIMGETINKARLGEIRDVIALATETACTADHQSLIQCLQEANEQKIEGDLPAVLQGVTKRLNLTEAEGEQIKLDFFADEDTRFGLSNAITKAAQSAKSFDRRVELETAGAKLLTDDKVWKGVRGLALEA